MSEIRNYQQWSYGFDIYFHTNMNLTDSTDVRIKIYKEDSQKSLSRDVEITDAAEGIVAYHVEDTDFDVTGNYQVQIVDETGDKFLLSQVFIMEIEESIINPRNFD